MGTQMVDSTWGLDRGPDGGLQRGLERVCKVVGHDRGPKEVQMGSRRDRMGVHVVASRWQKGLEGVLDEGPHPAPSQHV